MPDLQSDIAFNNAQAGYDSREPKDEPECLYCYGTGKVVVASFLDADGKEHPWPVDYAPDGPEIACPCYGASERERIRREGKE